MSILRRDFLPADLAPIIQHSGVSSTVAVQAEQTLEHTNFLLQLSKEYDFIAGVVGWIDLQSEQLEEYLAPLQSEKKLVGFRHILQSEPPGYMQEKSFIRGVKRIGQMGYTYDLLIHWHQMEELLNFVGAFGLL